MRSSHIPLQQSLLSFLPVLSDSPSSLSHTPHLSLHHLHQLRQHPFYLPALHLIVVEVHIIQEFSSPKTAHATEQNDPQKNDNRIGYPPPLDAFPLAVAPFEQTSVYVSPSVHFCPFCNPRLYFTKAIIISFKFLKLFSTTNFTN